MTLDEQFEEIVSRGQSALDKNQPLAPTQLRPPTTADTPVKRVRRNRRRTR